VTETASRRGVALPAVFTTLVIAGLVALGVWQLQRRTEKHELMAALSERLAASPVPLPAPEQWPLLSPARDEFRRVRFTAMFKPVPAANVYSSGSALRSDVKGVGTFAFQPAVTAEGRLVAVDRGFVPEGATAEPAPAGATELTGYLRFPEATGWLTPAADLAKRLWFVRDVSGMAEALQWGGDTAPFYVALEAPVPPSGVPRPGRLDVHLKDDHLQYAITWFGLALAVAIAFAIWLRGTRRGAGQA
jgi:cytochrome oxidase assembly protein ShyY1